MIRQKPIVVIDNKTFELDRMIHLVKYPQVVKINVYREEDKINSFWAYRSNSELGLWRLCITTAKSMFKHRSFYKGSYDYIQSTLLHMILQRFINENIDMIPIDASMNGTIYSNLQRLSQNCVCNVDFKPECKNQEAVEIVDTKERRIVEEPFRELYKLDNRDGIGCGVLPSDISYRQIEDILRSFSDIFKSLYDIVDIQLFVKEYLFTFVDIFHVKGDIYTIELQRKEMLPDSKTNRVLLFFMVAKLDIIGDAIVDEKLTTNVTQICSKKYHVFPFLLTIPDVKINDYGLYDKYIPCGLYICKLFDYSHPSNNQCSQEEKERGMCNDTYSYIGNRYDELFPLKEAIESFQSSCDTLVAGKRRRHSRRKRRRQTLRRRKTMKHRKSNKRRQNKKRKR